MVYARGRNMRKKAELIDLDYIAEPEDEKILTHVVASIVKSDNPGEILIRYKDHKPAKARVLSNVDKALLTGEHGFNNDVLVVFDEGNPQKPIIVGVIQSLVDEIISLKINDEKQLFKADIDNHRVVLEAEKEIVLKCGKGKISINKEGKIIILGTDLISRASGSNKIKGGNVRIN